MQIVCYPCIGGMHEHKHDGNSFSSFQPGLPRIGRMRVTEEILDLISSNTFALIVETQDLYLTRNGKPVKPSGVLVGDMVQIVGRVRGGKGGFGSMLRAIGAQIEKTTNREACRDLSGRRLRDINDEKRLKAWIDKQAERQKEAEDQKLAKLEKLRRKPKHVFEDKQYMDQSEKQKDDLFDALEVGLQGGSTTASENDAQSESSKRKLEEPSTSKKKPKTVSCPPAKRKKQLWVDPDLPDDLSDASSSEDDEDSVAKHAG